MKRLLSCFADPQERYDVPLLGPPAPLDASPPIPETIARSQTDTSSPECKEPTSHLSTWAIKNAKSTSALLQLPDELLLAIMMYLPPSSLYILRQTCGDFRRLVYDFAFKDFQLECLRPANESFCMTRAGYYQRLNIRGLLARSSLCDVCTHVADSGELARRMRSLYQPVYCSGCKKHHPALFFPPNQQGERICLGLVGYFPLCAHRRLSGQQLRAGRGEVLPKEIICKNIAHLPRKFEDSKGGCVSTYYYPKIFTYSRGQTIFLTRTIILVHLDHRWHISMDSIRQRLSVDFKHSKQLCKHASTQLEQVLDSLASDRCDCFPPSGLPAHRGSGWSALFCKNHEFSCQDCGATYNWRRDGDPEAWSRSYVVLQVRSDWCCSSPLTIGWLANLDYDTFTDRDSERNGNPILDRSTKGVLWCDEPGCGTGSGLRWLRMAKTFIHETSERLWDLEGFYPNKGVGYEGIRPLSLEYETFQDSSQWYQVVLRRRSLYSRHWGR
ncbi:hypothetical protein ACJZ2D_004913 [Fusarium nematophilum]